MKREREERDTWKEKEEDREMEQETEMEKQRWKNREECNGETARERRNEREREVERETEGKRWKGRGRERERERINPSNQNSKQIPNTRGDGDFKLNVQPFSKRIDISRTKAKPNVKWYPLSIMIKPAAMEKLCAANRIETLPFGKPRQWGRDHIAGTHSTTLWDLCL